jgi:hypothetical protein
MANRYWVGGAGTWNVSSTTNWSTSSGGGSGASVPTSTDDVIFDGSSGTGTIALVGSEASPITCKSLTTTGATITLANGGGATGFLDIYGNFTIGLGTTVTGNVFTIVFRIRATSTVTVNNTNNLLTNSFLQLTPGVGNTVTLGSNIAIPLNNSANASLILESGTLDLGSNTATVTKFNTRTADAKAISVSTGKFVLSGTPSGTVGAWDVTNGGGAITFNNTINIDATGSTTQTFTGGGKTYGTLSLGNTSTFTIADTGNTFGTVTTLNTTNSRTLSFAASTTNTITTYSANGSSGNILTLSSGTAGTNTTLSVTNTFTIDYANIADITLSSNNGIATNSNVINSTNWKASPTSKIWAFLTSGTSWTAPSDWITTASTEIHVLGGGGGGSGNITTTIAGGAGGGGAGYTKAVSVTIVPSNSYTFAIGSAGSGSAGSTTTSTGGTGGTSTFLVGVTTYTATGGTGGVATSVPTSTAGSGGVGSNGSLNYTGGGGGTGTTTGTTTRPAGGGGGAAGPSGNGAKGGNGFASGGSGSGGGGGGGNGGGTAGSNGTASAGGAGGNTALGVKIGGNGGTTSVQAGSPGTDVIDSYAGGGGGAGGGGPIIGTTGGNYGGGGSGAGASGATPRTGGAGRQGMIALGYTGTYIASSGNMFIMF